MIKKILWTAFWAGYYFGIDRNHYFKKSCYLIDGIIYELLIFCYIYLHHIGFFILKKKKKKNHIWHGGIQLDFNIHMLNTCSNWGIIKIKEI